MICCSRFIDWCSNLIHNFKYTQNIMSKAVLLWVVYILSYDHSEIRTRYYNVLTSDQTMKQSLKGFPSKPISTLPLRHFTIIIEVLRIQITIQLPYLLFVGCYLTLSDYTVCVSVASFVPQYNDTFLHLHKCWNQRYSWLMVCKCFGAMAITYDITDHSLAFSPLTQAKVCNWGSDYGPSTPGQRSKLFM